MTPPAPASWTPPAIFDLIAAQGGIAPAELWRTFNMGAGMVLAVDEASASACLDAVEGATDPSVEAGALFRTFSPKNMGKDQGISYHPGAEKYYKEAGIFHR